MGGGLISLLMVEMSCIGSDNTPLDTTTTSDTVIGISDTDKTTIAYSITAPLTEIIIPLYGKPESNCSLPTGYVSVIDKISSTQLTHTDGLISVDDIKETLIPTLNLCVPGESFNFNSDAVLACDSKNNAFMINVQLEYNYYYKLYVFAMNRLIKALQGDIPDGWMDATNAVNGYIRAATVLNTHVNDIVLTIDTIASTLRSTSIPSLVNHINNMETGTGALLDQSEALTYQRSLLASGNTILLAKEMEQYSRQKAKYHNNMLMLYSFLNITALGLLFYVYRSG